jgi:hypothetical protein
MFERWYDTILADGLALHEAQPALVRAGCKGKRRGRPPRRVSHNLLLRLSSTFRLSFLVAHISVQKMVSAAMKRRAWSSGRMVRPNGPVGEQRSVRSDQ